MDTRDVDGAKKMPGPFASRLRQERERRAWAQSEVAERIGTTQVNVSRWENGNTVPSPYFRQRLSELFGKSIEELGFIFESSNERIEGTFPSSSTPDDYVSPSSQDLWNVPYRRNPFFTGRQAILDHLYTVLKSSKTAALTQPQAISGLGGIGKTQIAVEYAYRYRDHYQAIFWINASTRDAMSADFVVIASLLGLPEQQHQEQDIVVRTVKRWLTNHNNWLLILDNVDNLAMVVDSLPMHITGDVLLTTRLQALGTVAQSIEVEKMGEDEGMTFLLRRIKVIAPGIPLDQSPEKSKRQAAEIFFALDGLPLALDQAGAYIEETRCGLSQYLNLYSSRRKELLLRRGRSPLDHPDFVTATWSLSFQQVKQESLAAAELLYLLAFLDPEAIPEEIITLGAAELGPVLSAVANDPLELDSINELLLRYSLIRRTPETKLLSVHRLVQAVLKDGMNKDTQSLWAERAIRAVNCAFPKVELHTWERCQRVLPHVQICATYVEAYGLAFPEATRLFNEAASYLVAHGWYEQAKLLLQVALVIRQKICDANHPDIAHTLNDLGAVHLKQGKYQEAEQLLQKALILRRQVLGEAHPDVAQTLHHLADVYRTQGIYTEAEPLYLEALNIRESALDIDPSFVAESYYGLGKLYHSQEKYQHAERLCQRAILIQEQYLGENHPSVASTLSMLAKIYQKQNKLALAKEMNMRALKICERISGEAQPQVATIFNSLVEIYHAEGRYSEAIPLIEKALKIYEQLLGSEHPFIAYSLSNQAENFYLHGNYPQAEFYYQKVLAIREQHLGLDHPHTATTWHQLAKVYIALEMHEEAKSFYQKALSVRERTFGPYHPLVVDTQEQYAIF